MAIFSSALKRSLLGCLLAADSLGVADQASAADSSSYVSPLPKGSRTMADDDGRFVRCLPPPTGASSNFDKLCATFLSDMKLLRVAHPLKPIYKEDWISADDYPQALRGSGTAGRSIIQVTIDEKGQVSGCSIVASSGSAELDRAACDATTRKARFAPRMGRDGAAEPSTYSRAVNWKEVK